MHWIMGSGPNCALLAQLDRMTSNHDNTLNLGPFALVLTIVAWVSLYSFGSGLARLFGNAVLRFFSCGSIGQRSAFLKLKILIVYKSFQPSTLNAQNSVAGEKGAPL